MFLGLIDSKNAQDHDVLHTLYMGVSGPSVVYRVLVLSPNPTLSRGNLKVKMGLVAIEHFLGCAKSAALFSHKPIRLQVFVLVSYIATLAI